ncbi:release factor glutamine methyltransferase [Saccharopolyspora kobensis]|uniref:Release factor glutamine methyltransferase n=1 Tax=Saccharopolyspora kobensis TaxID=146035 RepID=A0A1H6AG09_9PSEU|nr:HemK2/MTQ2 family protein methyltransferase [Saccharopolyspora kobensis]SEG47709.1 release factor glutamine methyltransferase [Saccharopolyspora kobensis]SFE56786.1 release factor glutamine methyltransferase [Saccharopolyspora kobensis]
MHLVRPPGVYRAADDTSLLADVMRRGGYARGRRVLDLGCGTGALALAAARAGAASVTAVDLSLRSIAATWLNARAHRAPVVVRRGDLFEPVRGQAFDLVLANPPYVPAPTPALPRHRIARCWDAGVDGRQVLDRICAGAVRALTRDGTVLIVQSEVCDESATVARMREAGLRAQVIERSIVPFGPVMRARAALLEGRELLEPGRREEELVVVEARRA